MMCIVLFDTRVWRYTQYPFIDETYLNALLYDLITFESPVQSYPTRTIIMMPTRITSDHQI
jgi:hypothetical protein